MGLQTEFTRRLGIEVPIIQAPMAGGGDTPALVAASCEAGGLGSVGAAYLSPEQITATAKGIRTRGNRPFGINLFAPQPAPTMPRSVDHALETIAPFFAELGLETATNAEAPPDRFDALFEATLASGAAVFSFTFGIPPRANIQAAQARGMLVMGTATTVAEARALEDAGVDAIVAQGAEAGGHRGTFAGPFEMALVGTMALVPLIVDAVAIPVVASGGIADGRGIAAALALGAQAVQIGTAFLVSEEAGIPDAYKLALGDARECDSRVTRAFSGRPARGIVNRFMETLDTADTELGPEAPAILPFPAQNSLTRPMRTAAASQGKADYLSLWAGQAIPLAKPAPASEIMARLVRETEAVLDRLPRGT